jgi:hypothetical protein
MKYLLLMFMNFYGPYNYFSTTNDNSYNDADSFNNIFNEDLLTNNIINNITKKHQDAINLTNQNDDDKVNKNYNSDENYTPEHNPNNIPNNHENNKNFTIEGDENNHQDPNKNKNFTMVSDEKTQYLYTKNSKMGIILKIIEIIKNKIKDKYKLHRKKFLIISFIIVFFTIYSLFKKNDNKNFLQECILEKI